MWGEVSEDNREKDTWGARRKEKTEGDRHPLEMDRNLLERLGEAERERKLRRQREKQIKRRREGTKEGRSLERNVPKKTEASW